MNNRFAKNSGCYKCQCCGRKTRSTGNLDNELAKVCEQCYELGGLENRVLDCDYETKEELEKINEQINKLQEVIVSKGGKLE